MRTMAYIKGQWEWIACQAGIIILVNVVTDSTPLAKLWGDFLFDLLCSKWLQPGFFFTYGGWVPMAKPETMAASRSRLALQGTVGNRRIVFRESV